MTTQTSAQTGSGTVVLIEDDPVMSRYVFLTLTKHGYEVLEAANGELGLNLVETRNPVVVLVDLNLPDLSGIEITLRLRQWTQLPIIVLTADGQEESKVAALDAGADDYVTKPFNVAELLARLRVARRHAEERARGSAAPVCKFGPVEVNLARHQVMLKGAEIHLTGTQYNLLAVLVRHAGQVVTHKQLLKEVWGPAYEKETNYLRVYMKQLREKLEQDPASPRYLLNEPGIGYRLQTDE